jgi:hypothetical protein
MQISWEILPHQSTTMSKANLILFMLSILQQVIQSLDHLQGLLALEVFAMLLGLMALRVIIIQGSQAQIWFHLASKVEKELTGI